MRSVYDMGKLEERNIEKRKEKRGESKVHEVAGLSQRGCRLVGAARLCVGGCCQARTARDGKMSAKTRKERGAAMVGSNGRIAKTQE